MNTSITHTLLGAAVTFVLGLGMPLAGFAAGVGNGHAGASAVTASDAETLDESDVPLCWGAGCDSSLSAAPRQLTVVSATCTATSPSEPECPKDDTANALNGLSVDGEYIHYRAASVESKTYSYVVDLNQARQLNRIDLIGKSYGSWCEDGELGGDYCHNDNAFKFYQSPDNVSFYPLSIVKEESCARLDDGCWVEFPPTRMGYLKIEVVSQCYGCDNNDYVDMIVVSNTRSATVGTTP